MKIAISLLCNICNCGFNGLNLIMGTIAGYAYLMMLEAVNWIWALIPMWCR